MTSREVHVAAVARGDGDAEAGADAMVSEEETPAAPQRAARENYVAAWLKACATGDVDERDGLFRSAMASAPALVKAAREGDLSEFCRLLEAEPASAHQAEEVTGVTPLMAALDREDKVDDRTEMVRLLLAAPEIDVNRADAVGRTALMYSCSTSNVESTKLLLAVPRST